MPIQITNTDFVDEFGVSTIGYKSNAGDKTELTLTIRSAIRMATQNNPLTLDPSMNIVTSPSISWVEEGFRIGDFCLFRLHTSGGVVMQTWWSEIVYVDDTTCDFGAMPYWYNISLNQFIVIIAVEGNLSFTARSRDDMEISINHTPNNIAGSVFSLIDGEASRAKITGIAQMLINDTIIGDFVGNQSGQFFQGVEIKRIASAGDGWTQHELKMIFINSGMYDETWFSTTFCLKFYMQLLWASLPNDPYEKSELIYNLDANTGFYNEANNNSIANSILIQGITEIDYCLPSSHQVIVDGEITDIGIGACYISTDDDYYRNRLQSQTPITMIIPTTQIVVGSNDSAINEFGAGYTIVITNIITLLATTTIEFDFIPNAQFNTFMSNVDNGDRLFYLWIKNGNINHLAFENQLTCDPPTGGVLNMVDDFGFLDHSENIEEITGIQTGYEVDTEDDVAYFGTFRLLENAIYGALNVKIEAFNTFTGEDFTLQETNFSFAGVQISNQGRYLLNETLSVNSELPTTSNKINSVLNLRPAIDVGAEYGVAIYYPFILNWKTWLQQQNASVDFYPTQNKDWEQYDNLANWELRIKLSLIENGLAFTHTNTIIDHEYNHDDNIESIIELIRDTNNSIVNVIPTGELMRIRSVHTKIVGNWNPDITWGMITIEPNESNPRSICSSVVNFDSNITNPLTPLANLLISIVYPLPNVAVLECYFDSTKIDLSNGVDITAKIKENVKTDGCVGMIFENDNCILLENGNSLIVE